MPNSLQEKYSYIEEFYQKIPSYRNWNPNSPKQIYELVTEIETVLINEYQADLASIEKASLEYVNETQGMIDNLIKKASTELQVKNIDGVIEIYKSIIDLSYEIKDFKLVSEYTKRLDEILKIVRKEK